MKLKAEQAMFYLFQFFQMLGTKMEKVVVAFLLDYSKKSPLFSHNLIWHCKLESKTNPEDDNYFQEHKPRRNVAQKLIRQLFENFSAFEKRTFDELDVFLTRVTDISSAMRPDMTYDEKLATIARCTESIKIPQLAYLPTNPLMQVVEIVKGSGKAMQSAAKCPFLLSFICKPFEGIDKVIAARKQNEFYGKLWNEVSEKVETSIEIKYMKPGLPILKSPSASLNSNYNSQTLKPQDSFYTARSKNDIKGSDSSIGIPIFDVQKPQNSKMLKTGKSALKNFDVVSQIVFSKFSNAQTTPETLVEKQTGTHKLESSKLIGESIRSTRIFNSEYTKISCIFKTKDDIRQDFLTIQFITLLKQAFKIEKTKLLLSPYRVFSNRTGEVF